MTNKKHLGDWGEALARQYLERRGYQFISNNYKAQYAELDLIFRKGGQHIFIEVKTRTKNTDSVRENTLSARQVKNLKKAICSYCLAAKIRLESIRLDLIVILVDRATRRADLTHYLDIV